MSGHSKWSSIKHKKALKDARRGKLFTKLIKEITVAARMGGGDVNANPRLRTAVLTARQNSMPTDNIERAINKGTGELEGVTYDEVTYEGYGPGGVAILVQALTDNRNRTVAESGDILEVVTAPDRFDAVKTALEKTGVPLASAEVTMMPQSTVSISGKNAEHMVRLLEALEDHDDVQSVSSNMDIAAEELERLSAA